MATRYLYNNQKFISLYDLRQAIFDKDRIAFGEVKTQQDFTDLGLAVVVETYDPIDELTPEQKEQYELQKAKRERAEAVANLKVEVDGMMFDGDEDAQSRMTRAIQVAEITGTPSTEWVLADNTVATVTLKQMKEALSKSMLAMGELWTVPYEGKSK